MKKRNTLSETLYVTASEAPWTSVLGRPRRFGADRKPSLRCLYPYEIAV